MKKRFMAAVMLIALCAAPASAAPKVLTLAERTAQDRAAMQGNFFSRTGEAFKNDILTHHRGGVYGPWAELREAVSVTDTEFDGHAVYLMNGKNGAVPGATKKILYVHGGAWVLESPMHQLDFAAWLANNSGAEVWFPEYPLAPEHHAAESHEWLVKLYQEMLKNAPAAEIAVMGDSAGGAIAAGLAMQLRDRGLPQPNNLILFSPGVDIMLYRTDAENDYNNKLAAAGLNAVVSSRQRDIMDMWRGDLPETDYRVNPVYGDLRGLAPLTVFAGSAESISIHRFIARAAVQRVPVKYWEKLNAPHVWVTDANQDCAEERAFVLDLLRTPDDAAAQKK